MTQNTIIRSKDLAQVMRLNAQLENPEKLGLLPGPPTAQHLGVTDPFTAAALQRLPKLGTLRPFTSDSVPWTVIGKVVVWDQDGTTLRTEHNHPFARHLIRAALTSIGEDHNADEQGGLLRQWSIFNFLDALKEPLSAIYPQLTLTRTSDENLASFVEGGFRSGRFYRALLPGAQPAVRRAARDLVERDLRFSALSPNQLGNLQQIIHMANLLLECGDHKGAQHLLEHTSSIATSSGLFPRLTPKDLRIMTAARHYDPRVPAAIKDSASLLRDLLHRLDLQTLDFTGVEQAFQAGDHLTVEQRLIDLPRDRTGQRLRDQLRRLGLRSVIPFAPVDPQREMTVQWGNCAFEISAAANSTELEQEGERLSHCVGSSRYVTAAATGHSELYFIRPAGLNLARSRRGLTAEVQGTEIVQLYGAQNAVPKGPELIAAHLWMHAADLASRVMPSVELPSAELPVATYAAAPSPQSRRLSASTGERATACTSVVKATLRRAQTAAGLTEDAAQVREQQLRRDITAMITAYEKIISRPALNPHRYPERQGRYLIGDQWRAEHDRLPHVAVLNYDPLTERLTLCAEVPYVNTTGIVHIDRLRQYRFWPNEAREPLSEDLPLGPLLQAAKYAGKTPTTIRQVYTILRKVGTLHVELPVPGTAAAHPPSA